MDATNVARPRDLREALGLAFVHRGRICWRSGERGFLGLEYSGEGDGVVVDIAGVPEFRAIESDRFGVKIGAFAGADDVLREPLVRAALGDSPFGPEAARFRLSALDAQLIVAGMGATRTTRLETLTNRELPPNEIPVAVTLKADPPKVSFADRRIRRRDGKATFELRVFVALRLRGMHRIAKATVAYMLDEGTPVVLAAVGDPLTDTNIARGTFATAARHAADAFRGDDEKTNVLRRTIIPLTLSALKEAYDASRAA